GRADGDEEEADDAADGREDRDEQDPDDLPLDPLGALGTAVGEADGVRLETRVDEALGHVGRVGARGAGQLLRGTVRAHEDLAPIHTARPMSPPIPTIHTQKPSETGPRLPRLMPPGSTSRCSMT